MTVQVRTVIEPVRRVSDLYRGRKFRIVARFPGGRTIQKGFAQTRQRALKVAQRVNAPQTSPTAGATTTYVPELTELPYAWKINPDVPVPIFY